MDNDWKKRIDTLNQFCTYTQQLLYMYIALTDWQSKLLIEAYSWMRVVLKWTIAVFSFYWAAMP